MTETLNNSDFGKKELLQIIAPEHMKPEAIPPLLDLLKEAGMRHLVISAFAYEREIDHPGYLANYAAMLDQAGLSFRAAHGLWSANNDLSWPDAFGRRSMIEVQSIYIRRAAELGCRTFVVHPGSVYPRYPRAPFWDYTRESVEALLPVAEENRIILALENNVPGDIGDSCAELGEFIRSFHSPWIGACFDSGHANVVGGILQSLKDFSDVVVTCHLHDNDGTFDQHRLPGDGNIPWKELMEILMHCTRLEHCEIEGSGMFEADRVMNALSVYRKLPGLSLRGGD